MCVGEWVYVSVCVWDSVCMERTTARTVCTAASGTYVCVTEWVNEFGSEWAGERVRVWVCVRGVVVCVCLYYGVQSSERGKIG